MHVYDKCSSKRNASVALFRNSDCMHHPNGFHLVVVVSGNHHRTPESCFRTRHDKHEARAENSMTSPNNKDTRPFAHHHPLLSVV